MELEWIKIYKHKYVIGVWLILLIYLWMFFHGYFQGLDQAVYAYLHSLLSTPMTSFMMAVTFLGSVIGVVLICLFCLIIHIRCGLIISINVAIVALGNVILKNIIQRPRPSVMRLVHETGYSFPSAHAMASFALFGLIAYFLWRKNKMLSVCVMCLPLLIGITRIYLGVHYASDVLAGFLFSSVYLCMVIPLMKYHKILP